MPKDWNLRISQSYCQKVVVKILCPFLLFLPPLLIPFTRQTLNIGAKDNIRVLILKSQLYSARCLLDLCPVSNNSGSEIGSELMKTSGLILAIFTTPCLDNPLRGKRAGSL